VEIASKREHHFESVAPDDRPANILAPSRWRGSTLRRGHVQSGLHTSARMVTPLANVCEPPCLANCVMLGWSVGAVRSALEILAPGGSAPTGAPRRFRDGESQLGTAVRGGHAEEAPAGFHAQVPATGAFATT